MKLAVTDKGAGVAGVNRHEGKISPDDDTKNSDKKVDSGSTQYDIDDVSSSGLHDSSDPVEKLAAAVDDDTTKTNEWHHHAHSTTCISDSDCSSKYTCESGQCMPYQPDQA